MSNENFVRQRFYIPVILKDAYVSNLISPRGSHANNESILSKVLQFYDINVRCKLIYTTFVYKKLFSHVFIFIALPQVV